MEALLFTSHSWHIHLTSSCEWKYNSVAAKFGCIWLQIRNHHHSIEVRVSNHASMLKDDTKIGTKKSLKCQLINFGISSALRARRMLFINDDKVIKLLWMQIQKTKQKIVLRKIRTANNEFFLWLWCDRQTWHLSIMCMTHTLTHTCSWIYCCQHESEFISTETT